MTKITDLRTIVEGFRLYCLAEGKQPTTVRWYMHKLDIFQRYLKDHDLSTNTNQITTTHLRQFLVYLQSEVKADQHNPYKPTRDDALSPRTIQGYARTLKAFFSWATVEGYLSQDPAQRLKIPKAPKAILETFSDGQIHRLLRAINQRNAVGFRATASSWSSWIRASVSQNWSPWSFLTSTWIKPTSRLWVKEPRRELSPSAPTSRKPFGSTSIRNCEDWSGNNTPSLTM